MVKGTTDFALDRDWTDDHKLGRVCPICRKQPIADTSKMCQRCATTQWRPFRQRLLKRWRERQAKLEAMTRAELVRAW